jgi:hypothetical protein
VGGIYKIIAKILANKLKMVLEKIISTSLISFIRIRQIINLVLSANECFNSKIRCGEPGVLCKMELEKIYDHVN